MRDLWQDLGYGVRVLGRARGFTAVAILVLGLGIGASATIFSAINGVLLRPLPYPDPDRLVAVAESNPAQPGAPGGVSVATFTAWKDRSRTLAGLAAYRHWGFDLTASGEPERIRGARVSANLFSLLGESPLIGRSFAPGEDAAGAPPAVLVSEELWRRRFGADPRLLHATLQLNGQPYTVIGVIPRGFGLPEAEVWTPLTFAPYEMDQRGNRPLSVIGRLDPSVAVAAAQAEMQGISRELQRQYPASNAGWGAAVRPLKDDVTGTVRAPLLLLFAATCAVLLVACANLANLLLAKGTARHREIALRAALGASRLRIARQLVTENMLLVLGAASFGLVMAEISVGLLARAGPGLLPRSREIGLDPVVLGFVLVLALITGSGLALIPVYDAVRLDLSRAIKAGSAGSARRGWRLGLRDLPVVGQVALALVLLVSGGLLVRSFLEAQAVHLGFAADDVLSMTVSLSSARYSADERKALFFAELRSRVTAIPGVRSAGLVSHLPLAATGLNSDFIIDGRSEPRGSILPSAHVVSVTPGYFQTMAIPLRRGRPFVEADRTGSRPVVVIDEAVARRYWPGDDPLGKRIRLGTTLGADTAWREVIGVVSEVRFTSPENEPDATIYVPHAQNPWPTMALVVRTSGNPERFAAPVTRELHRLDPDQPAYNVRAMDRVVARALAPRRLETVLMAGFAIAALLLAIIGVYGTLAYAASQRTRDFGIRVALGANRGEIIMLCMREALARILAGFLVGAIAVAGIPRLLGSMLFGVAPWDPAALVSGALVLGCAGLLASYLPARRAASLDPLRVLRSD